MKTIISSFIVCRSITKSYYRNSVGVVLVYDTCNRESFVHLRTWMSEAERHILPYKAVFILAGCKRDLACEGSNREVTTDEASAFANRHGIGKETKSGAP